MAKNKASEGVMASPRSDREYHSVSVRKIDNGYIVSRSHEGPHGYKSSETYCPKKPKIEIPDPGKPSAKERKKVTSY